VKLQGNYKRGMKLQCIRKAQRKDGSKYHLLKLQG